MQVVSENLPNFSSFPEPVGRIPIYRDIGETMASLATTNLFRLFRTETELDNMKVQIRTK
jgi:hypothetical protein